MPRGKGRLAASSPETVLLEQHRAPRFHTISLKGETISVGNRFFECLRRFSLGRHVGMVLKVSR